MNNFQKVVRLGVLRDPQCNVYCKIEYTNGRLSIMGVEGPTRNGNAVGGCGQLSLSATDISEPAPGWSTERIAQFLDVWEKWHLNDMRAGSPAQRAHLATLQYPGYSATRSHYEWACDELRAVGLHPDAGYLYGSSWLREDVPDDVVAFLFALPDTDIQPAWV